MPLELSAADIRERRARGAMRALTNAGEDLLGRSSRAAPIREGNLRASASLAFIVNGVRYESAAAATSAAVALARAGDLRTIAAEVSFDEIYAARQHEETGWRHPIDGESKYLERPLLEQSGRYGRALELEDRLALA